jgi:5-formyltetrahydrofolate cyclo-ligase
MTENVSEAKARLRTKVLTDRSLALAAETADLFGKQLLKLCGQLGARTVGVYLSFGSEPPTDAFVVGAKAAGISLAAPRTGPESSMEFALLQGPTESTALGFLQPVGEIVEPNELDLIIAPALSLDEKGNRLGRGGGFFDRYLAEFGGSVAAVVYDHELLAAIPNQAHDKAVHYAVTQSRIQPLG